MSASDDANYLGREQSLIKHIILEKYLERFAVITGSWSDGIIYVDGFSGPWNVQSESLEDASFSIALKQLRNARDTVKKIFNKELKIRCVFLEKKPGPFARLKRFAEEQKDANITVLNVEFAQAIPHLVMLIKSAGGGYFPFIFIDPTGWKGFAMQTITPLLRLEPSEILVNFMTGFIMRFAEDRREEIGASFEGLFGDAAFRNRLRGLDGREREDALVFEYARRIGEMGGFPFVPVAVVPHPTKNRTHFHLVYATRNIKGLEVFKGAERRALSMLGEIRADAKRREREQRTNQPEFLTGSEAPDVGYVNDLAAHYGRLARESVHSLIREERELSFDEAYAVGMRYPTIQLQALRQWIEEIADIGNLGTHEKVGKPNAGHRIKIRGDGGSIGELKF